MRPILEHSAGVIPYRIARDGELISLLIPSARARCPRARGKFPKGGIEPGESPRRAVAREFVEETGLASWHFREGFQESLSYTDTRDVRRRFKTVTYFVAEVLDDSAPVPSWEHAEDPAGRWYVWGSPRLVIARLGHERIRAMFLAADAWLRRAIVADGGPREIVPMTRRTAIRPDGWRGDLRPQS